MVGLISPTYSQGTTTEECLALSSPAGAHQGCTVCVLSNDQSTCRVDTSRSSCSNGFEPDPSVCAELGLTYCVNDTNETYGVVRGDCIGSDSPPDPEIGYWNDNNVCRECIRGSMPDCKFTTLADCRASTSSTSKFKCVDKACVQCGVNETGCVDSFECQATCEAPITSNNECTKDSQCFSNNCNEDTGECEKGVTSIVCSARGSGNYVCRTAIGEINTNPQTFSRNILRLVLGFAGGILLLMIILNGYKFMTSQGDPEKIKDAREGIIAAIAGILLIIFSLSILQLITVDIIGIPGFSR